MASAWGMGLDELRDSSVLILGRGYDRPMTFDHWTMLGDRLDELIINGDDNGDEGVVVLSAGLCRGGLPSLSNRSPARVVRHSPPRSVVDRYRRSGRCVYREIPPARRSRQPCFQPCEKGRVRGGTRWAVQARVGRARGAAGRRGAVDGSVENWLALRERVQQAGDRARGVSDLVRSARQRRQTPHYITQNTHFPLEYPHLTNTHSRSYPRLPSWTLRA